MKYERLLAILSGLLVIVTTWMTALGRGGDAGSLQVLMGGAVVAIIVVDLLQWIYLPRLLGNITLIGIAIISLSDFLQHSSREQLLIIGNLLVAVQCVLLCERKTTRIHGEILVFSLLTVVVASLLNHRLFFGFALFGYSLLAILALAVYAWNRTVETSGIVRRRWRSPSPDVALSLVKEKPRHAPSPLHLIRILVAVILPTFAFSAIFFIHTPRLGGNGWNAGGLSFQSQVGFAPEISFDDMSKLLTNESVVMRVMFTDAHDELPYALVSEPYFFGAVLTRYVVTGGEPQWKTDWLNAVGTARKLPPPKERLIEPVRVSVLLEPSESTRLFYVYPAYAAPDTPEDVRFDPDHQDLFRRRAQGRIANRRDFQYDLISSSFRHGLSLPVTPHINPARTDAQRAQLAVEKRRLAALRVDDARGHDTLGEDRFKPLQELTEQILKQHAPDGNGYDKAMALNAWFHRSGRFNYTLDLRDVERQRDESFDPIVDFVVNHRTGHCQYFASGLAMMLRAAGVPSRIVVGYKGGDYNPMGNYYVVRQKHAHAWVEAYLEPDEMPEGKIDPAERHRGGGWLRLDPTPTRNTPLVAQTGLIDRVQLSIDYAQWVWNDYVVKLDPEQQGWNPTKGIVKERSWLDLLSSAMTNSPTRSAATRRNAEQTARTRRVTVWIGLAVMLALGLFYLSVPFLRPRRQMRRRRQRLQRAIYRPYAQFEKEMARYGWRRRAGQTPRQFAAECGRQLAEQLDDPSLRDLPLVVVDTYYRVRFDPSESPDPPSPQDRAVPPPVEQALAVLRECHRAWRRRPAPTAT